MSRLLLAAVLTTFVTTASSAHTILQQGPPPEIRALLDGFAQAVNGGAASWEAYAQKYFAPALLKAETAAQRQALHQQIVDRFGQIARGPVRREGPEAPLLINVKGEKASGVISVSVDDSV